MEKLGRDELMLIFSKLDNPKDEFSFINISKQFLAVSCFYKTRLKRRFDSRLFDMLYNWLPEILSSCPKLESFYFSKPLSNNHMKLLAESCPNLDTLDLPLKTEGDFVFDFNDDGLCAVANVCNRLCDVVLSGRLHVGDVGIRSLITSCKGLRYLNLGGCVGVTDESLKAIGKSTCRLGCFVLKGCYLITDLGLKYLANGDLKISLCGFDLSKCDRISDDGIIHLKQMVNLRGLNLSKCGVNVTDAGIVELVSQLKSLTCLNLSWLINVTEISLRVINIACSKLEYLKLSGCGAITVEGLSCHNLDTLGLPLKTDGDFVFDFKDDGLCAVANAHNRLYKVDLSGSLHVGDVGIRSLITSCKRLSSLNLGGCVQLTDESLKAIGKSTWYLSRLVLKGCYLITDLGLKYLANGDLKNTLRTFDLSECDRISDYGIIHLKQMLHLRDLNLSKCGVNVTDAGIVKLVSQLLFLANLDLSWLINVTDISLPVIAIACSRLKSVDLSGCEAITIKGLFAFAINPSVSSLRLYSCHNISQEDVKLLASTRRWLRNVKPNEWINMWQHETVYTINFFQIDWK